MIPKISVRPAASMNSSSPYWTLFSSWIRKLEMSRAGSRHPAAGAGIGQGLGGDADHLVLAVLDAAQVDVLDRVVRLAHGPLAARAVDRGGLHRLVQCLLVRQVALHGVGPGKQQLAAVVALHRIDIGLQLERGGVRLAELLVARRLERIA